MNDIDAKAIELASRPYITHVEADECGGRPCFVAYNDELPGCMAQGDTWEAALKSLDSARRDYIQASLLRGFDVPAPQQVAESDVRVLVMSPALAQMKHSSTGLSLAWEEFAVPAA